MAVKQQMVSGKPLMVNGRWYRAEEDTPCCCCAGCVTGAAEASYDVAFSGNIDFWHPQIGTSANEYAPTSWATWDYVATKDGTYNCTINYSSIAGVLLNNDVRIWEMHVYPPQVATAAYWTRCAFTLWFSMAVSPDEGYTWYQLDIMYTKRYGTTPAGVYEYERYICDMPGFDIADVTKPAAILLS